MNNLTKITDLSTEEITAIIDQAFAYKQKFDLGIRKENILGGKMVAMVFEKPSLRTKVAFEIATEYLGGTAVYLSAAQILASGNNIRGRESIPDIARNLERFSDLILARVYNHDTISQLSNHVTKPVINALCDLHHPTQSLADLMVIKWHKKDLKDLKVAYVGDGNNVATSLMQISTMMGMKFSIASPKGFEIRKDAVEEIKERIASPDLVEFTDNPEKALTNADVVYTDTFVSMGQEEDKEKRLKLFEDYRITLDRFLTARSDAIFLHCLPAHRGEEVVDEVLDHERSVIFDQAECRMHIAKSLMHFYLS